MEVTQLVRAVTVAEVQYCSASDVADACRGSDVSRVDIGIVAQARHQCVEETLVEGKEVNQCAIRAIADRLLFVGESALRGRPAQRTSQLRADSLSVVGRPRVIHAGMN